MSGSDQQHEPYIPADRTLPEITLRAVVLGVVLAAILAGANAYLGLFAGLTVSASIPAAVISLGILKLFRNSNILENNIVQTAASAGESLAAGAIFTLPALVMLEVWTDFNYLETTLIVGFGGVLGVLFTVPLRRALIVESKLKFPEGIATAEVLMVGDRGASGIGYIAWAGVVGALFKFGERGLLLWSGVTERATYWGGTIAYFGSNLSPALVAVGYIVGINIAVLVFVGGALNWLVAIPIVALVDGIPADAENAVEAANTIWSTKTRYLGVGAMVVGGLSALVRLRHSLASGIRSSIAAYRRMRSEDGEAVPRTEREAPFQWVAAAIVGSVVPLFLIFEFFTGMLGVSAVMAVIMLLAGFLFSAVAGYMAGLVGSSNNPISGVTIATILVTALLLLAMLGRGDPTGPAAAIFIGAVVCCAAAIAGDNMQDLKAGYRLGATPLSQQIMQVVGVAASAVVMAPIMSLLLYAYGMGAATPEHPEPLAAPQAALMASVARGVFEGGLPWLMIGIGMAIAVAIIALDLWLEKREASFRAPVLAIAVGIYLPFELSVPIFAGGLVALAAGRKLGRAVKEACADEERAQATAVKEEKERHGLLFAAGLITGEALIGIAVAIPIVIAGREDVLAPFGELDVAWPGVVLLAVVIAALYRIASIRR